MNGWRRRRWTAPTGNLAAAAGPSGPSARRLCGWALAGAGGVAAFAILHVWAPSDGPSFTICPLRRFTGLPCPGCGMTRAFAHLAKGEWSAAVHDHPLAPLLAAELALLWAAWGASAALGPCLLRAKDCHRRRRRAFSGSGSAASKAWPRLCGDAPKPILLAYYV